MAKNQNSNAKSAVTPNTQPPADQANTDSQAPAAPANQAAEVLTPTPVTPTTPPVIADQAAKADEGVDEPAREIFRVTQPLTVLIVGGTVDIQPLVAALLAEVEILGLPQGIPLIEELSVSLPAVIGRYGDWAKQQQIELENVLFTVADPETDSTLKTVNFLRAMQGLGPTYIYPDILTPEVTV